MLIDQGFEKVTDMQWMIMMFFSLTVLFGHDLHEKLIVTGDTNITKTQMNMLKLKMYFSENAQTRELQEKNNFNFEMEMLGEYAIALIRPISSPEVKNTLSELLKPLYPDLFFIEDKKAELIIVPVENTAENIISSSIATENTWIEEIGLQWITLLLLSFTGLILSIRSRRKMENMENIQEKLMLKQEQIEDEIKNLGASRV